jgi:hypothetical protein
VREAQEAFEEKSLTLAQTSLLNFVLGQKGGAAHMATIEGWF